MKLIKKKCPYCGSDLSYTYGDHEAKCKHCRQSLIVEYERLPFTEIKAMLEYYTKKREEAYAEYNTSWHFLDESFADERYLKIIEADKKRLTDELDKLDKRVDVCEQMLDEAMDDEVERRKKNEIL